MINLTKFQDKAVLVTGGAGFIGSEAVQQLLSEEAKVTVFDNFSSGKRQYLPKKDKNLRIIKGDITDEKAVNKATKDQEIIFHFAARATATDHPGTTSSTVYRRRALRRGQRRPPGRRRRGGAVWCAARP